MVRYAVRLKSLEWLKKNAHQDNAGDYWESKSEAVEWANFGANDFGWHVVTQAELAKSICIIADGEVPETYEWCTIELYNSKDNPEIFI